MAKEMVLASPTAVKPLEISLRQERPSSLWVTKSLTALATARQATLSRDTLILYASEICDFREDDVSKAIRKIAVRPREEGETAFPDLGTLLKAIKSERSERVNEEEAKRSADEYGAIQEDRRLHPEKYFSVNDLLRDFAKRQEEKRGI